MTTVATESAQFVTRRASLAPASINVAQRTAEVTWTTGARALRGFFDRFYEELSLDPKHVRMERLSSGRAPLLNGHRNADLSSVLGVVESANLEKGKGVARVRFAKDAEADAIFQKVQDGIIQNVSVGYRVYRYEKTEAAENKISTIRAVDWEPFEISLVPLGEDAGAAFRSATLLTEEPMEPTTTTETQPTAAAAERQRAAVILQCVRTANLDHGFAEELIRNGTPLDEARALVLDRMAARDQTNRIDGHIRVETGNGVDVVQRVAVMAEALAARFGGPAPSERAREFLHFRAVDFARSCLESAGIGTRLMSPAQIVERALHTTSDFPALLSETGNRFLRHGYASYQGGVRRIAKKSTAPDFRAKSHLNLSEAPALKQVGEAGEFTRGTMAESKESYSIATYGRVFGISRQAIVNDDLGAFGTLTVRLGRAAAEFVAQVLVNLLTSNPTLSDGIALFHASHGNLGTPAAIAIASLGEALKLMRLQKGLDGVTPIDATPKFLTVPAALEVVARQYVAQINATKASDVNPFTADLKVVIDPRLDANSATAWYVAADPSVIDTIEYSFLEGEEGPQIFTREGFDVDGLEVKVRLDFGAGVIDHRGLVKNAGL